MGRHVFGESILELRWDWPTVGGPEFPAVVAALGGFFVVGGDGGVGASKRFQTCQRAAIFFGLDLCPVGEGAHVPGELRVEERDRIIAIAATDAEVAHVGGDHFGFREAFGELEDTVVGHVHRWPIVRDRSANLYGFPVEHELSDHPALPRQREHDVDALSEGARYPKRSGRFLLVLGWR